MLQTVWLWLLVPSRLYRISTYLKPIEGAHNVRALLAGIVGLADAAFGLHATHSLFFLSLPHSAILCRMAHGVVGGMMAAMLLSLGQRYGVRVMLVVGLILFLASTLLVAFTLHRMGRELRVNAILASPHFYGLASRPVGIAISAFALLLRPAMDIKASVTTADSPLWTRRRPECCA